MIRFGFAREVITPARGVPLCGYFNPRPNTGKYDDLYVRAALFEANGVRTGFVVFDLCFVTLELCEALCSALKNAGLAYADDLVVCAIHSHTAPYPGPFFGADPSPEIPAKLVDAAFRAVVRADASFAPAELFAGRTECDTLAFNRRYFMKNGTVLTNPGKGNPDAVRPEGPVDTEIPLLKVRQEGRDVCILANIVNHTDTIGGETVSADWPGRMENAIRKALDSDIDVVTLMGCSGNINHFDLNNPSDQTSYEEACRIGKGYAEAVLNALPALEPLNADSIKVFSSDVEIPFASVTDDDCRKAKELLSRTPAENSSGNMTSEGLAAGDGPVARFFAEQLLLFKEHCSGKARVFRLNSIHFGDALGVVSLPGEPFTEIGLSAKKASRFPLNFVVELANGECGYIPLPECFARGGYEILPVPGGAPAHDTAPRLASAASALLQK